MQASSCGMEAETLGSLTTFASGCCDHMEEDSNSVDTIKSEFTYTYICMRNQMVARTNL